MKTILLVRHGQSETNVQKVFTGQIDAPLTDMGRQQAQRMAAYVSRYKIGKIYASSLQRAVETAQPIALQQGCPLEISDALREINAGAWQGLTFDEIAQRYPESYQVWRTDFGQAAPENGETCEELFARVSSAFTQLLHDTTEQTICIVAHATPIRMIESYIKSKSVSFAQEISWVPNASVTVYQYDGEFRCLLRGYCDYLGNMSTNLPKNI